MNYYYSIFIQWSEEDNKFIAHLPSHHLQGEDIQAGG